MKHHFHINGFALSLAFINNFKRSNKTAFVVRKFFEHINNNYSWSKIKVLVLELAQSLLIRFETKVTYISGAPQLKAT